MKLKKIFTILLLLPLFVSCDSWFDGALPRDRNLEDMQYDSESGINAVLNGIYRSISSESLYGGKMTMTTLELLAHYYYYEDDLLNQADFTYYNHVSKYLLDESDVKSDFTSIWRNCYTTIFRINNFIKNVEETTVISSSKRDLYLGEAYGLRAFLHLDLWRVFGDNNIPYNRSWEVVPQTAIAKDAFFNLIQEDINKAKSLLANDPIQTEGVKDQYETTLTTTELFASYLRNCRFNYYAVMALEARALAFKGDIQGAATVAQQTLDACFGDGKPFTWADKSRITTDYNYIFYSEVIFGVNNIEMYSRWKTYTDGTRLGKTYTVINNNLRSNIFKYDDTGGDMSLWEDVRIRQWTPSKIGNGHYVSNKYSEYERLIYRDENDPIEYLQPLIRTSELHYLIAENEIAKGNYTLAMEKINTLRFNRGSQLSSLPDPATATETLCNEILETEYYKEFYGEGQVFFFLKRKQTSSIFEATKAGRWSGKPVYTIPLPEIETNI